MAQIIILENDLIQIQNINAELIHLLGFITKIIKLLEPPSLKVI